MNDLQRSELSSLFQQYRNSKQYQYRKEQTAFCSFAQAVIEYLVYNSLFDEGTASALVHLFDVKAKKDYIISKVQSLVKDGDARNHLLTLLDQCSAYGFTAVGKAEIELTISQSKIVETFLKEILECNNADQIKAVVSEYNKKGIPNCTTGIYSPWLHYIHPTLCPIANSAIEPFLSYIGMAKSKKSDYLLMMDVLAEAKEAVGAEDYSILDNFLLYFNNMKDLVPREPRYWIFNHKYDGATEEDKRKLREQAVKNNYAFMQYEYGYQSTSHVTMNWKQAIKVREGDFLFLRSDAVYAVGKAIRPIKQSTIELNASKVISKKDCTKYLSGHCTELITFEDAEVFYEDLTDGLEENWGQRIDVDAWKYYNPVGIGINTNEYLKGTVYDTIREITKQEGQKLINELYKGLGMKAQVMKQLQECKNLILTGAPGTGKTYLAKQVARLMLFGKSDVNELNEEEKELYKQHVEFVQFHPSYDYSDFVEGLRPVKSEGAYSLGFERRDGIFKAFCKRAMAYVPHHNPDSEQLPFIMIIDEINRGELSKILGELFYSIDPGYRGDEGRVKTQYQNMIGEGDDFANGFYVPDNVYIIGTMNDIDRSVESMDFAIRRRFAWQEIKAYDTITKGTKQGDMQEAMLDMLETDIRQKAKDSLMRLNDKILDPTLRLGPAYQIGASYFLKLKENPDFENLWECHLKGVLCEYLRGQSRVDENIEDLHNAFKGN